VQGGVLAVFREVLTLEDGQFFRVQAVVEGTPAAAVRIFRSSQVSILARRCGFSGDLTVSNSPYFLLIFPVRPSDAFGVGSSMASIEQAALRCKTNLLLCIR